MDDKTFFKMRIGSKLQVWNGTAAKTSGGLTKTMLIKNKRGRIVSKKQAEAGRKAFARNREKLKAPFGSEGKPKKEEEEDTS